MVCEYVEDVGYCYMSRATEPHLKCYDGMRPTRPTAIEDFGFEVTTDKAEARFIRKHGSSATYEDGKSRQWQDQVWTFEFSLPLVDKKTVKRRHSRFKLTGVNAKD